MKRSPFQALPASPSRERESTSIIRQALIINHEENRPHRPSDPATTAKLSWQREVYATKTAMMSSGLARENAYALAAKVVGAQFGQVENLSVRQLREIRAFFAEELQNGNQG